MKRQTKFYIMLIIFGLWILFLTWCCVHAGAEELPEGLIKGAATAYCGPSDHTCTGDKTRIGICGGCKKYIHKTIILYHRLPDGSVGPMIGIYECLDTGTGTEGFQQGRVIDVWQPTKEDCQKFMNLIYENGCKGKVYIQVVDAQG